jgi:hypothetical protein
MRFEDLKTLSHLERALWAEPTRVAAQNLETLGAVSLLVLSPERRIERTSTALLHRASGDFAAAHFGVANPFYRLSPEERFLLSALHSGRWSYARLSRLLERDSHDLERVAWAARLHLVSALEIRKKYAIEHPTGGGNGVSCPEYDGSRPWTQRFLDDELQGGERHFLTTHLVACDGCRAALQRCRKLYYAVDAEVPRANESEGRAREFERVVDEARKIRSPIERTFFESLAVFARRGEVRRVLFALGGLSLYWLLKS